MCDDMEASEEWILKTGKLGEDGKVSDWGGSGGGGGSSMIEKNCFVKKTADMAWRALLHHHHAVL